MDSSLFTFKISDVWFCDIERKTHDSCLVETTVVSIRGTGEVVNQRVKCVCECHKDE